MAIDAGAPGELTGGSEDVIDYDEVEVDESDCEARPAKWRSPSPVLLAGIAGLVVVVALGTLSAWLGHRAHESQQAKSERDVYLQVARQGALDLTTIDYQHADADIQRILDSATGQFHDDFSQGAQRFVDVVEKANSISQGTITEAGLQSVGNDEAHAIVAVSVTTAVAGAPEEQPRSWRMRLTMQRSGGDVKISGVGFVA